MHGIEIFLAKKGILKADFWQKMFLKTSFISAKVEQIRGWKNLIGRRLMTSRVLKGLSYEVIFASNSEYILNVTKLCSKIEYLFCQNSGT